MKGQKYLLIGLVFGVMIGWALGFLRLPYIEKNFSFLLGFTTALVFVSLILMVLFVWNKPFLDGLIGKKSETEGDSQSPRAYIFIRIMLMGALVLGGVMVYRWNESFKLKIQNQDKKIQEMAVSVVAVQKNNLEPLLRNVLDDVGKELNLSLNRTLSDTTIARIAALSAAFKPYKYIKDDSLSKQVCSPERGQLLQSLVLMNIDTGAFARIKRNVSFDWADLRGADLKGLDLSGINLKKANLENADLSDANLKSANLGEVNLWGANLNRANLSQTDLKRADLRWAQLNEAALISANLNGANLINAQLRKANLNDATLQWTQLGGTLFNEASLISVDFVGSNFTKVNLSKADLRDSDLRKVNLSEAVLDGARLNKAIVDESWLEKLNEWRPTGANELRKNYKIVNDTFNKFNIPLYRLIES